MKTDSVILPPNREFGLFFSLIFFLTSIYFYHINIYQISIGFGFGSFTFFLLSLTMPHLLTIPNKLWIRFGILLGKIINPIILGVIFFGIFSFVRFIFFLIKRDELKIKVLKKDSYWVNKDGLSQDTRERFKQQF